MKKNIFFIWVFLFSPVSKKFTDCLLKFFGSELQKASPPGWSKPSLLFSNQEQAHYHYRILFFFTIVEYLGKIFFCRLSLLLLLALLHSSASLRVSARFPLLSKVPISRREVEIRSGLGSETSVLILIHLFYRSVLPSP